MRSIFQERRFQIFTRMDPETIVLLSGAIKIHQSADQMYPFRQYGDFYYLTVWQEADAVCVLYKTSQSIQSILFHKGYDLFDEKWHGGNYSHINACKVFGFDQAYPIGALESWLQQVSPSLATVYVNSYERLLEKIIKEKRVIVHQVNQIQLKIWLQGLRLYKSDHEIALMKRSCSITAQAHIMTMRQHVQSRFKYEREVAAAFQYHCLMQGASHIAYETIAAGGVNACILHYTNNRAVLSSPIIILLDAGASVDAYCGDVTRCWPISGKFTPEQRIIYAIVLTAHQACLAQIKPGITMCKLQEISEDVMISGLKSSGIVEMQADNQVLVQAFFGHAVGHSLGIDVHDPSPKQDRWILDKQMIITVEPGLYMRDHGLLKDKRFANIGMRIEDNILVTKDGYENLTKQAPVQINEIEALLKDD